MLNLAPRKAVPNPPNVRPRLGLGAGKGGRPPAFVDENTSAIVLTCSHQLVYNPSGVSYPSIDVLGAD